MIDRFRGQYGFLSNFFCHPFKFHGEVYASAEHAYQASKTNDPNLKRMIMLADSPAAAKLIGKTIALPRDWEWRKLKAMKDILRAKFAVPQLAQQLRETGNSFLIEGNYHYDIFWGVYLPTGKGDNHLGILLMEVRQELLNGADFSIYS